MHQTQFEKKIISYSASWQIIGNKSFISSSARIKFFSTLLHLFSRSCEIREMIPCQKLSVDIPDVPGNVYFCVDFILIPRKKHPEKRYAEGWRNDD